MKKTFILFTIITLSVACNNPNNTPTQGDLNDSLPSFVPDTDGECCDVPGDYIQGFDSLPYPDDSIALNF